MIELRPHHGLCIRFFQGKGYNSEFTEHMRNTIEALQEKDSKIFLVEKEDEICRKCPNFLEDGCRNREKVCGYDRAVIEKTGIQTGVPIKYEKFRQRIGEQIINTGEFHEICSDCGWADICHK